MESHAIDLANLAVELAVKLGASYADARVEACETEQVAMKNGDWELPLQSSSIGIGIRVIANGGEAFASTTKLARSEIKSLVKRAVQRARLIGEKRKEKIELSEEKSKKARWRAVGKELTIDELMDFLKGIDGNLKEVKLAMRFLELTHTKQEKLFVNSEGSEIRSEVERYHLFYNLLARLAGKCEQRYFYLGCSGGFRWVKRWNASEKIAREATLLQSTLHAKKAKAGKYDVILSPELVGIIVHECVGHPFEADRILGREAAQAGKSYASVELLGKRIGSVEVSVVDDPTIKGSYGFYLYDDEGVKARKRTLIERGVVKEFLQNRKTAFAFNTKSNAAARASSYAREPIVRMANTFILPGSYTFDELIEDVKRGIFINSFTEWNIDDKRVNQKYVGCEAYLIENGEIKGLVRRPVIELTTFTFLSSIDACSRDLQFVAGTCGKGEPMQGIPVFMGGPYIRLRNVVVK